MNVPSAHPEPRASNPQRDRDRKSFGMKVLGTFGAIVVLALVGTQWPQRTSDAATATQPASAGQPDPQPAFEYFPAQYLNTARNSAAEEPIQAF